MDIYYKFDFDFLKDNSFLFIRCFCIKSFVYNTVMPALT